LVFLTKVSIAIVFFLFGAALLLREESIAQRERQLAFFYEEDKRIAADLNRLTSERTAAETAEKAAEAELQRQIYGSGGTRAGYGPQARAAEDARRKSFELKQSLMARADDLDKEQKSLRAKISETNAALGSASNFWDGLLEIAR
jgi:hypothetical protein